MRPCKQAGDMKTTIRGVLISVVSLGLVVAIAPVVTIVMAEQLTAGTSDLEQQVSQLVVGLDSKTREERTRAIRKLVGLGPEILPYLPLAEDLTNDSVREAVRHVRIRLERFKAEKSIQASTVDLRGTFPLKELLSTIAQQSGNHLEFADLPTSLLHSKFRVDYRKQAFWKVLDVQISRLE